MGGKTFQFYLDNFVISVFNVFFKTCLLNVLYIPYFVKQKFNNLANNVKLKEFSKIHKVLATIHSYYAKYPTFPTTP